VPILSKALDPRSTTKKVVPDKTGTTFVHT